MLSAPTVAVLAVLAGVAVFVDERVDALVATVSYLCKTGILTPRTFIVLCPGSSAEVSVVEVLIPINFAFVRDVVSSKHWDKLKTDESGRCGDVNFKLVMANASKKGARFVKTDFVERESISRLSSGSSRPSSHDT